MIDMSNCTNCLGTGWDENFNECDCGATGITPERGQRNGMREDAPVRRAGNGAGKGARPAKIATVKQVAYLNSLIEARDAADPAVIAAKSVTDYNMPMALASALIDALRAIAPAAQPGVVRSNRYPGKCGHCGKFVAEGAGRIEKLVSKWVTFHLDGACPANVAGEAAVCPVDGLDLAPLAKYASRGLVRFAVPGGDTRLKLMLKFANDGRVWVTDAAVYGERTTYGCQRPGDAYRGKCADALRAVLADPTAALVAYAELTGACAVCGRHLEQADSVAQGMGPVCAGKAGI
jgi:hypothetical protein